MPQPRRVILLGSTGSIGESTIEVVRHLQGLDGPDFSLVGLATGSRIARLLAQADEFDVHDLAVADPEVDRGEAGARTLRVGPDAARELVESIAQPGDLVIAAVVGSAGIDAVLAAIDAGCDVALANKETLVAAGSIVMPRVAAMGVKLLPVDSEHSAIFQCLHGEAHPSEIRRLVITASGGPFRGMEPEKVAAATPAEALAHPTWSMGPKITIDSASMMNKALEVIEAHWLFDLPAEKIDVIVHPQSIVHSFVEYMDGSVLAQLGPPDMETPIQCAMTWPERVEGCSARVDWLAMSSLVFEQLDHVAFPAVQLALKVIRRGGNAGAVFNAANEVAVEAFLAERIRFGQIVELVSHALDSIPPAEVNSLEEIMAADQAARAFVRDVISSQEACMTASSHDSSERS